MAPFIEVRHYTGREGSSDSDRSTSLVLSPTAIVGSGGTSEAMVPPKFSPPTVPTVAAQGSSSNSAVLGTPASTSVTASPTAGPSPNEYSSSATGATVQNAYSTGGSLPPSSWVGGPYGNHKSAYEPDEIPISKLVMAVLIPLIFLGVAGALLLAYIRRRKRRRNQTGTQPQMKRPGANRLSVTTAHAHYATPPPEPTRTNSLPSPPTEPVLLSSVIPMSSYYNTGIDTSDAISLSSASNQPQHNISETMYAETMEEPPPPYRPRSVPPASRQSSVRNPASHQATLPVTLSETNLMAHNSEDESMRTEDPRSPFADPVDGDGVSITSGRERGDRLSAVSDLSYQADPPPAHEHV